MRIVKDVWRIKEKKGTTYYIIWIEQLKENQHFRKEKKKRMEKTSNKHNKLY